MTNTITIKLNNESYQTKKATSLAELVQQLNLTNKRIAIELNEVIVPRSQHTTTQLNEHDIVEIVHAIGGG